MATYLRYNSTIKGTLAPCNMCEDGVPKRLVAGLCPYHYKQQMNKKSLDKELAKGQKEADELEEWFLVGRKSLTGKCIFCSGKTEKNNDATYKRSMMHLFPKAIFKSIAMHSQNLLEGCFYGNSHHTNFDNGILTFDAIKEKYPKAWEEIIRKSKILIPLMTNAEKGRIPEILLQSL